MAFAGVPCMSFFPRADAAVLTSKHEPPPPRPDTVGPVFDPDNADTPIESWPEDAEEAFYVLKANDHEPAPVPERPDCHPDRYLRPFLAKDERLRLSMLWYYTRGILAEDEFLSGLQEKAHIAQESTGWDCAIIGILDVNFYIRLATAGVPLAILPRGEATCAHTINQPSGSVFLLPDLTRDWRFQLSPNVELGGLRVYAGVPLRIRNESGQFSHIGSLCVASTKIEEPLTKSQQQTLTRLADWVVSDIVQCARANRQRERRRMSELIFRAQKEVDGAISEEPILRILNTAYPDAEISLKPFKANQVEVDGRDPISWSDFQDGLWEDVVQIDDFITNSNHQSLPKDKIVRVIAAKCDGISGPSILAVASRDFQMVLDDIDSWFIQICATMASRIWHKLLLSEAMRAKEKFLRGFSHQLRTPIHGILGSVDLLAEELKSASASLQAAPVHIPGKSTLYLDTIKTAGRDLISIVNSMITINRWADIAMTERRSATHSISELESELADEIRKTVSGDTRYRPSIIFNHDLPRGYDGIFIDLRLLRDSLLPLIINAIQNTPQGVVVVTISIHPDAKELVIDIEDTGCGIHPDDHIRIFEPYEKVSTHSTGAGLGLSLASKFAALLQGNVTLLSSTIGQGSHFRAVFREAKCNLSPLPTNLPILKLRNMPLRYYTKPSVTDTPSLCYYFARHLTSHGLNPSDNVDDGFIILDFDTDMKQHRTNLSQVPPDRVALCLVPTAADNTQLDETFGNVVYVRSPFLTSTTISALEKADNVLSAMKDSQPKVHECHELSTNLSKMNTGENIEEKKDANHNSHPSPENLQPTEALLDNPVTPTLDANGPHAQDDAEVSLELNIQAPIISALTRSAKPKSLLVDDNPINLRIMQMYCAKRGLPYYCAADGLEAVKIFSQQQTLSATGKGTSIELILMDLQMPICDGIEATRQIRALEKEHNWDESILFMVTGQDSSKDRTAAEGAGAHEYFVKPVGIKVLDQGVKQHFPKFKAI